MSDFEKAVDAGMPSVLRDAISHPVSEKPPFDLVGEIMAYESGDAEEERIIALFQYLVDTGKAWSLQGSYGRMATRLIEAGYVSAAKYEQLRKERDA